MPSACLTDITIRSLKLPKKGQTTYWDENLKGFGVRVSQGGAKAFVLVYGVNRQRHTIGRYPTISLKEGRGEAKRLQAELTLGLHKKASVTYNEAKERFLDGCRQKNKPRTIADYTRILNKHFRFGRKHLGDITRIDIQRRLDKLKKTPSERHHAFVTARVFFNWAEREDILTVNPIGKMRPPGKTVSRDRVLSDEELALVLANARKHPYPYGPIMILLALTGQRRGEIAALEWDWIDQESRTITLPTWLTKNSQLHVFPYGDQVAEILTRIPQINQYLFPARISSGTTFNGWGKAKARFDSQIEGVEPYTIHDLRRTFSSNMAKLGTPIHVTEKLLNHISGTVSGVAAIYNRHSYMDEMRQAISNYDTYLAKLID